MVRSRSNARVAVGACLVVFALAGGRVAAQAPVGTTGRVASGVGTGKAHAAILPEWGARYVPQRLPSLKVNEGKTVSVRVENVSSRAWNLGWPASQATYALSCRWFQGTVPAAGPQCPRVPIQGFVASGGTTAPLPVAIRAPSAPGTYLLKWDLVEVAGGGEQWFSSHGVPTFDEKVTVTK